MLSTTLCRSSGLSTFWPSVVHKYSLYDPLCSCKVGANVNAFIFFFYLCHHYDVFPWFLLKSGSKIAALFGPGSHCIFLKFSLRWKCTAGSDNNGTHSSYHLVHAFYVPDKPVWNGLRTSSSLTLLTTPGLGRAILFCLFLGKLNRGAAESFTKLECPKTSEYEKKKRFLRTWISPMLGSPQNSPSPKDVHFLSRLACKYQDVLFLFWLTSPIIQVTTGWSWGRWGGMWRDEVLEEGMVLKHSLSLSGRETDYLNHSHF